MHVVQLHFSSLTAALYRVVYVYYSRVFVVADMDEDPVGPCSIERDYEMRDVVGKRDIDVGVQAVIEDVVDRILNYHASWLSDNTHQCVHVERGGDADVCGI
jgi:hypothetical protein